MAASFSRLPRLARFSKYSMAEMDATFSATASMTNWLTEIPSSCANSLSCSWRDLGKRKLKALISHLADNFQEFSWRYCSYSKLLYAGKIGNVVGNDVFALGRNCQLQD